MLLRTAAASCCIALLMAGCASKEFADVQQTAPLPAPKVKVVEIEYAAGDEQRKLLQPFVEAALYENGARAASSGQKLVVAPLYIGDYMRYNDHKNPIRTIPPLSQTQLREKIAKERDAAKAMSESLYYRFSEASDFASVGDWTKSYGLSVASAAVTAYMIDGLVDADGYQMITDVYLDGKRTRIFAHTFDSSLEPKEAITQLAKMTGEKIAKLVTGGES